MDAPAVYDPGIDDRPISERVIHAVADATGRDPLELPPLYDVLDPDGLDALFDYGAAGSVGRAEFTFDGCEVAVRGDGRITVSRATPAAAGTVASAPISGR